MDGDVAILLRVRPPIFLAGYRRSWLRGDVIAGLTVWAVLVPEALAYATVAGVSPGVGLYAAPGALILYAAFGSSKHLVVGPMSATAALSAAAVAQFATHGSDVAALTATLAIVTGLIALVAGLLRLGFLANFISEPVMKGFIVGLALTIMVGQLPKLFGVESGEGDFFQKLWDLITKLGSTKGLTLAIGLASLVIVLVLRRIAPAVPGSLVVVGLSVAAVYLFNLDQHGVEIVGPIKAGLPHLGVPDASWSDTFGLSASAVGVMLVGFAEGLGAAKTYAARHHYDIDTNRELLGLGAANVAAGLSSGMVVNGSLSKTAVNGAGGARSQVSGLVVAGLTVLTLLFLTPLFEDLPEATLAAVVIAALIDRRHPVARPPLSHVQPTADPRLRPRGPRRLHRGHGGAARRAALRHASRAVHRDRCFPAAPGLPVVAPRVARLGQVPGAASLFADLARHPEYNNAPGVVVLRVEGALFFADAEHVRSALLEAAAADGVHAVVIDAETMPAIDVTAVEMLKQVQEELGARNVRLLVAHDIGQVRDLLDPGAGTNRWSFQTVGKAVRHETDHLA